MSQKRYQLLNAEQDVAVAGTAEALVGTDNTLAFDVSITAKSTNTQNVYIGDSTVDNTVKPLTPGQQLSLTPPESDSDTVYGFDLNDIYVDSDVSTEGVWIQYLTLQERIS